MCVLVPSLAVSQVRVYWRMNGGHFNILSCFILQSSAAFEGKVSIKHLRERLSICRPWGRTKARTLMQQINRQPFYRARCQDAQAFNAMRESSSKPNAKWVIRRPSHIKTLFNSAPLWLIIAIVLFPSEPVSTIRTFGPIQRPTQSPADLKCRKQNGFKTPKHSAIS